MLFNLQRRIFTYFHRQYEKVQLHQLVQHVQDHDVPNNQYYVVSLRNVQLYNHHICINVVNTYKNNINVNHHSSILDMVLAYDDKPQTIKTNQYYIFYQINFLFLTVLLGSAEAKISIIRVFCGKFSRPRSIITRRLCSVSSECDNGQS